MEVIPVETMSDAFYSGFWVTGVADTKVCPLLLALSH